MTDYKVTLGDQVPGFILRNDLISASDREWDALGINEVDKIFINFCLSKLRRVDAETLIRKAAKVLKIGGHLRVADIDANNPDPRYQDKVRSDPFQTNVSSIMEVMGRYGFQSWPLEFHTADGEFHQRPIDPEHGLVTRSRLIDPRARGSGTYLSSLVVDGVLAFDQIASRHRMAPDDIREVYLGVLDRAPDCEQSICLDIARYDTPGRLATHLLGTPEFQRTLSLPFALPTLDQADYDKIIRSISVNPRHGRAGYYVGALGDCIDVRFASDYAKLGDKVQPGIPPNAEYYSVLKSVLDSDGKHYIAVELGAGHGTWSVRAGLAARLRAIPNIHLVAAEAAAGHFDFLSRHFTNNGFDPQDHTLIKCVIGDQDGVAYFPNLHNPAADWGARAISPEKFTELGAADAADRLGQAYSPVPALSIATIIRRFSRVDLLHLDIQGHEHHAVGASIADIDMKVRLMFIGTHSHQIDSALIRLLNSHGWKALHIIPKNVWRDVAGQFVAAADGEQLWINSRLQASPRSLSDDNGSASIGSGAPVRSLPEQGGPSQEELDGLPWWHTIDFPNGISSKGQRSRESLKAQENLVFSPLEVVGKSVIDVGAWNGYYAAKATQRGGSRVMAVDSLIWNVRPASFAAFQLVKRYLMPNCEVLNADVMRLTADVVGQFDITLFLGVLYHLKHPLFALENLFTITRECLVVETALDAGTERRPAAIFYPGKELNNDPSNWWGPNQGCVEAWLRTVGFSKITFAPFGGGRGVFHAYKSG